MLATSSSDKASRIQSASEQMNNDTGSDTTGTACGGQTAADFWGEPVSVYTRADALLDGNLVDVTASAKETGFRIPVAVTRAVWEGCIAWSEDDSRRKRAGQSEAGRLHDVLNMTMFAVRVGRDSSRVNVVLNRVPREGRGVVARTVRLVATCGGGDNAEPVITIMQPGED